MKQKLFCLCVASLFAFAVTNAAFAQSLAPAAGGADCACAKVAPCQCAPACNPCGYSSPCGFGCAPYGPCGYPAAAYPYYPVAYRVGLLGCVRPVVRYPYYYPGYYGYGYPYGYYPGYCW